MVGVFQVYPGNFYWFTVPFIAASGSCAVAAVVGLCWRARRSAVFWIVGPCHTALLVPFLFAMVQWPGGDDGPGMAWLFLIGAGSVVAFLLGAALMLHAWWVGPPDSGGAMAD